MCVGEESDFGVDNTGVQYDISGGNPLGWMTGTNGLGTPPNYHASVGTALPPSYNITTIKYAPNIRGYRLPGAYASPHGPNNSLASGHPGGVYGLFLDGSVHFINDTIDLLTLRRLVTRDDGNSLSL